MTQNQPEEIRPLTEEEFWRLDQLDMDIANGDDSDDTLFEWAALVRMHELNRVAKEKAAEERAP